MQAALARLRVRLAPRPQRLAAQRRRYTEERIAARVASLGFADVHAYLADRVVERGWVLAEVASELAAHRVTVRRLLERHGIRRVRRTAMERAAAESGRQVQRVSWQAQRAARLAELGFADLAGYLKARYVGQRWSVKRMRAELGVGGRWLVGELTRLGLRPWPESDRTDAGRASGRLRAAAPSSSWCSCPGSSSGGCRAGGSRVTQAARWLRRRRVAG